MTLRAAIIVFTILRLRSQSCNRCRSQFSRLVTGFELFSAP